MLKHAHDLPEGAEILAAMATPPHLKLELEDDDDLIQQIEQGKRLVCYESPLIP